MDATQHQFSGTSSSASSTTVSNPNVPIALPSVSANLGRIVSEESGKVHADSDKAPNEDLTDAEKEQQFRDSKLLKGKKLAFVFIGMLMSVWLIALDQTILAPALPVIASQFKALDQLAWIASAYFLTQTALLLLYGQILTIFDRKWTFLAAITLFEIGSIICAVAPTVEVLIFGRAFAGVGAAGIFVAVLSIIADVTTLEQRPKLLGLFGAVFAVSSVVGPLLGGAFTDHATWRWCFWINLPFGAITVVSVIFILGPQPAPAMREDVAVYTERKIARYSFGRVQLQRGSSLFRLCSLDYIGTVLMLGTITCLLLPLQWGGNQYPWSSGVIIGLFVAFAVLAVLVALQQWKFAGPSSILPLRLFKNRTQIGACLEAFFIMLVLLLATYFLPIYFQAAKGATATKSGIEILPYMLGVVFSAGIAGGIVSWWGYYWPFLITFPAFMCIGSGLLYTITADTSSAKLIGYQILLAIGTGACMQNTLIAVQADIEDLNDVPQSTGLVTFTQLIGGTIGIAIANTIFSNKLASALPIYAPDAPFELVRRSVEAIKTLPIAQQPGVIKAYVLALNQVFIIGVAAGGLASASALLIRNKSVKGKDMMAGGA